VWIQDIADGDISAHLVSVPLDAPSIGDFTDNGHIHSIFIIGDRTTTELVGKTKSICGALAVLVSQYYIFDLAHPRLYAMFTALLQHFVAQEPFKGETSRGFKTVFKRQNLVTYTMKAITAARVIINTRKFDSGLSRLLHDELHWHDVTDRSLHGTAPLYLMNSCTPTGMETSSG